MINCSNTKEQVEAQLWANIFVTIFLIHVFTTAYTRCVRIPLQPYIKAYLPLNFFSNVGAGDVNWIKELDGQTIDSLFDQVGSVFV